MNRVSKNCWEHIHELHKIAFSGKVEQPVVEWGIDWSAEHKMKLNLDKTKSMLKKFSPNTSGTIQCYPR